MKTLFSTRKNAKITTPIFWLLSGCFIIILMQSCVTTAYVPEQRTTTVVRTEVLPPQWAPEYDNVEQVHYYYLPDVEMYYDVWNHEYVYNNNGSWVFAASFPSYYSTYDINSAFVVVLDNRVSEPWRRHQVYRSSYPQYYYRSAYNDNVRANNGGVRGYNENARVPIYRNEQRSNATPSRRYTEPNQSRRSASPANNQPTEQRERIDNRRDIDRRSSNPEPNSIRNSNNQTQTRQDVSRGNVNNQSQSRQDVSRGNVNNQTQSRQDVSRGNDNNSNTQNSLRRTDNNRSTNIPERGTNVQQNNVSRTTPTPTSAPARSENTRTVEPSRTQPAANPSREVSQPVRVQREVQPARGTQNTRVERKEVKKDDSKTNSDDKESRRR